VAAKFSSQAWTIPSIFQLIQQKGNVDQNEMYQVFNMGIGMVSICSLENADRFTRAIPGAKVIGEVVKQVGKARVVIN